MVCANILVVCAPFLFLFGCAFASAESPIVSAIQRNDLEGVQKIVQSGVKQRTMFSALQEAVHGGNVDITRILLEHDASPGLAAILGAKYGKPEILRLVFERGYDLVADTKRKSKGVWDSEILEQLRYVMVFGAYSRNQEAVQLLLEHGADPKSAVITYQLPPFSGFSINALAVAAYNGDVEIAKLLIAHGADVNAQFGKGKRLGLSPLHLAVITLIPERGNLAISSVSLTPAKPCVDMVKLLLEHGAQPMQVASDPLSLTVNGDLFSAEDMKTVARRWKTPSAYDYVTGFQCASFATAGTPYEIAAKAMTSSVEKSTGK